LPKQEITSEAEKIHGWTKKKLLKKKAQKFTKGASERLMNFLNLHRELPIVAHNAKHDRDQCLKPAFEKVGNLKNLAEEERWKCT
jgi:DNA polymerase III epsilon subunit-like protein